MFRKALNISIVLVLLFSVLVPAAQPALAQEMPVIEAYITANRVVAWGYEDTATTARLEVYAPGEIIPKCEGDFLLAEGQPWLECPEAHVQPGDQVLLYIDGFQIKDLLVLDLSINVFDPEAGRFAGKAPSGEIVMLDGCNSDIDCFHGEDLVGEDGTWEISFGPDAVSPDAWYGAYISDEDSDRTYAEYIPPPLIDVNVSGDWVSARGFGPDDLSARLEVYDQGGGDPKCEGDFDLSEGDPWLDCWEATILPGDLVILKVDGTAVKDHIVFDLTLDIVDIESGYFEGTAPEWSTVRVDVCNPPFEECSSLEYDTEGSTIWAISFGSGAVDPEAWFGAFIVDEDGDQTMAELPPLQEPPVMDVNVSGDWISAWGFSETASFASFKVYDWETSELKCEGDFNLEEGDPWLDCWEAGIEPGDLVLLLVDGEQIKDHTVFDLTLDEVDLESGYFAGTAPVSSTVRVEVCNPPDWNCISAEDGTEDSTIWSLFFEPGSIDPDAWFGAFMVDEDGDQTMAEIPPPQEPPAMDVNVSGDWVSAWGFGPDDLSARLEVYDQGGGDPKCEGDFDLSEGDPWLDCWEATILPGDLVVLKVDGTAVKEHTVFALTLDVFDPGQGLFSGTALQGTTVRVDGCNPPCGEEDGFSYESLLVTDGTWEISFEPGEVSPDAWFGAFIVDDDGDQTMAELFEEPVPIILAAINNFVEAYDFGPGSSTARLEVQAGDGSGLKCEGNFDLPVEYNIWLECWEVQPDDLVLLFVDELQVKDHTVFNLTLDDVDLENGYFAGTAPEWSSVRLDICNLDQECFSEVYSTEDSTIWEIFIDPIMILPDVGFGAFMDEEDGDHTMADHPEIPGLPLFTINPDHGWVGSWGWPVDVPITLTIDEDTNHENGFIFQETQNSYLSWEPGIGEVWFELGSIADQIYPGLYVSMTDSVITKDTWIADLSFDSIDPDTLMAAGTGPDGGTGHVYLELEDSTWFNRGITIPSSGTWTADFGGDPLDLDSLVEAHVVIWDDDGDETMANLDIYIPPQPFFNVNLSNEMIHALGWPFGETITLEIDDPSTSDLVDFSAIGTVDGYASYDPELTLFDFDSSSYGIMPGFLVRIYDNNHVKEHIVTELEINEVNYDLNTVTGSTSPDSPVDVIGIGPEFEFYPLISDQDGNWMAGFSQDLRNFMIIVFSEWDEDGDTTQLVLFPNHPPVAEDDAFNTDEDSTLAESVPGVLSNDSDPENSPLVATLVTDVQHGTLILNPDGSFSYTPDQDYFGPDSFSYLANDGERDSIEAAVSITVNPVNDVPSVEAGPDVSINEGESFYGSGSFSDPDQDEWTATVDYYSDGVDVQVLPINPEKTFTLYNDYPFDDGVYTVTVSVNDGAVQNSDSLIVTINNVAPHVDITSDADGEAFILTGLDVNLTIYFTDPGTDTHSVLIDWGDGSQEIDPALSPVTESHVYQASGEYSIGVTVTDDDGGVGFASTNVRIVEPSEAAQYVIDELATILTDPELDPAVTAAVENALVDLEGANDGLGNGGALDKIDGGQWNAALVKIERAIQDLEEAENADPTLDLSEIKEVLALTAKSVALEVISQAGELANVEGAYALISEGQILLDGGNYLGAVSKFQDAIHVL